MDIKALARNILPFNALKANEAKNTRTKTDANNDREGNGQSQSEEHKRKPLTPEEVTDAVKYLESLPGIKDNNLTVRLSTVDGLVVIFIEDRDGKTVRRIPEAELGALTANRQKKSGHLLNKAL
jgi:uncharacterized FlaG/YvyC family protein